MSWTCFPLDSEPSILLLLLIHTILLCSSGLLGVPVLGSSVWRIAAGSAACLLVALDAGHLLCPERAEGHTCSKEPGMTLPIVSSLPAAHSVALVNG